MCAIYCSALIKLFPPHSLKVCRWGFFCSTQVDENRCRVLLIPGSLLRLLYTEYTHKITIYIYVYVVRPSLLSLAFCSAGICCSSIICVHAASLAQKSASQRVFELSMSQSVSQLVYCQILSCTTTTTNLFLFWKLHYFLRIEAKQILLQLQPN